jgi:hypothetical protein
MAALAYVIFEEGLADRAFLDACCVGHDEAHLPAAAPGRRTRRTSAASSIYAETPGALARPRPAETSGWRASTRRRPAALIEGYGDAAAAHGEQRLAASRRRAHRERRHPRGSAAARRARPGGCAAQIPPNPPRPDPDLSLVERSPG